MSANWLELVTPPLITRLLPHLSRDTQRADERSRIPVRDLRLLFPGIDLACVSMHFTHVEGGLGQLPLGEAAVLGLLCRHLRPRRIFEIGTFRGSSTLVMAMNTREHTEILTLDLDPERREEVTFATENGNITGVAFTVGELFVSTPFLGKIRQLYGDSAAFDFEEFSQAVDLVFVDGNHRYENVRSDSEHALRMVRPGGAVLWDDYHPIWGPGVIRAIDELATEIDLVRIAGTRFALYRNGPEG